MKKFVDRTIWNFKYTNFNCFLFHNFPRKFTTTNPVFFSLYLLTFIYIYYVELFPHCHAVHNPGLFFFLFETLCLHSLDKSYHSTVEVKRHEIEWKWFLVVHHHTFGSYTERWIKSSWMLYGLDFVEMSYEASVLIYPIHNFVTFNMISTEYSSW